MKAQLYGPMVVFEKFTTKLENGKICKAAPRGNRKSIFNIMVKFNFIAEIINGISKI